MTPQSSFMVLAAITPEREAELRELLDSMNDAPGRVNPNNALIAFAEFSMIHVARLLVLKDNSLDDIKVYGLPRRDYPLYLAFLGNIDGERDAFYEELSRRAPDGLRALFSCCEGFTAETRLVEWMKRHSRSSIAGYTNWVGRTVTRGSASSAAPSKATRTIGVFPASRRPPVRSGRACRWASATPWRRGWTGSTTALTC